MWEPVQYRGLYETIVNREYNIYKEIVFNPFVYNSFGIYSPYNLQNIVEYTKNKKPNILANIIPDNTLDIDMYVALYKILYDYSFFKTEPLNLYSKYVKELASSSKVEEVIIIINDVSDEINNQIEHNINTYFKNNSKIKIKKVGRNETFIDILKELKWNCISVRDVEQALSLILSDVELKNKEIILEELSHNKLDPSSYIILQEKGAALDYRSMI